jgi:hypothetical protein
MTPSSSLESALWREYWFLEFPAIGANPRPGQPSVDQPISEFPFWVESVWTLQATPDWFGRVSKEV